MPRRSGHLAAESDFRDPQPEKQAKRVLMAKWTRRPQGTPTTPDDAIALRFRCLSSAPDASVSGVELDVSVSDIELWDIMDDLSEGLALV